MKMKTIILLLGLCSLMLSGTINAQENPSLDEQLRESLQKDYFKLNVLVQSEGRFSFQDNTFQGGRSFNVPNARISIRGNLDDGFFYRVFVDAAPELALLDAFVGYKLADAFSFTLGAQKPRQTLDFIPDPGSHNFVDRANMTSLLVGARDLGISANGDIGGFYYYAGFFNGNRLESNNNNKFYGVGRLQYKLTDLFPGYLQLALSGSHGNSEGTISGSRGPLLRGKRTILGSDIELELNRFYLAAEYLQGELETVDLPNANEFISGYYFTGGFRLTPKAMTFCRWQNWSFKEAATTESKLTIGTNIDFTDIVGLVLNLDAHVPNQGDNLYGASFILQVQF
jgi:hypothetical protein